jgi:alpha-glucosidase
MKRPFLQWAQHLLLTTPYITAQTIPVPGSPATTSFRPLPTLPIEATLGANLLPNVLDPQAADAQTVCPGYTASNVKTSDTGLTAALTLAGPACNVYGNEVDCLQLVVEYQTDERLHVSISPTYISPANESWYILSTDYVPAPSQGGGSETSSDLKFSWSNEPSFNFEVIRKKTADVLFSTKGTKLVFEDQFIEFVTSESNNYNVYGLGEGTGLHQSTPAFPRRPSLTCVQ